MGNDEGTVLIHTDGACLNNGQENAQAGWAFYHGSYSSIKCVTSGRLEKKGPFGDRSPQTSNRAELRAVIAALRYKDWTIDGFHTIVIATDSEYTAEGSTNWIRNWLTNGWTRNGGPDVMNKDLWEALLGEVERCKDRGLAVQLWKIPRSLNADADKAAKDAASDGNADDNWTDVRALR